MEAEVIRTGHIKNEVVNEPLDAQRYGFLLSFNWFNGYTILSIRVELLLPIDDKKYYFCVAATDFKVYTLTKNALAENLDFLSELVQTAITHCRLFFMLNNPDHNNIKMKIFHRTHLLTEIKKQLADSGLLTS